MADRKENWEVSYIESDGTYVGPVTGDITGTVTGPVVFPTSDPAIAGAWWNNGGVLTISAT